MKLIQKFVKAEYKRRHKQALLTARQRKKKLTEEIPELKQAFYDLSQIGIKYSKLLIKGKISREKANEITEEKFNIIDQKIKSILLEHSYGSDYLNVHYTCNRCKDTGFTENLKQRCSCYKDVVKYIFSIEKEYSIFNYNNFDCFNDKLFSQKINPSLYGIKKSPRQQIKAIRSKCFDFIENISRPNTKNMLFTGNTGLGKTFMANCVACELLLNGYSVNVTTAPALFEITSGYMIAREEYSQRYSDLLNCNLLIIDDMGTEKMTDSRYAQLLKILDKRDKNDLSFPCKVIIITNSSINEIYSTYSERIASRIAGDFSAIKFVGNDIRINKKEVSKS